MAEVNLYGIILKREMCLGSHQLVDFNGFILAIVMSENINLNAFNKKLVVISGLNKGLIENYAGVDVTYINIHNPCSKCKKQYKKYIKHYKCSKCSSSSSSEENVHACSCDCMEECPVFEHPIFPKRPIPPFIPAAIQPIDFVFDEPKRVANPNPQKPKPDCKDNFYKKCKKCKR